MLCSRKWASSHPQNMAPAVSYPEGREANRDPRGGESHLGRRTWSQPGLTMQIHLEGCLDGRQCGLVSVSKDARKLEGESRSEGPACLESSCVFVQGNERRARAGDRPWPCLLPSLCDRQGPACLPSIASSSSSGVWLCSSSLTALLYLQPISRSFLLL